MPKVINFKIHWRICIIGDTSASLWRHSMCVYPPRNILLYFVMLMNFEGDSIVAATKGTIHEEKEGELSKSLACSMIYDNSLLLLLRTNPLAYWTSGIDTLLARVLLRFMLFSKKHSEYEKLAFSFKKLVFNEKHPLKWSKNNFFISERFSNWNEK